MANERTNSDATDNGGDEAGVFADAISVEAAAQMDGWHVPSLGAADTVAERIRVLGLALRATAAVAYNARLVLGSDTGPCLAFTFLIGDEEISAVLDLGNLLPHVYATSIDDAPRSDSEIFEALKHQIGATIDSGRTQQQMDDHLDCLRVHAAKYEVEGENFSGEGDARTFIDGLSKHAAYVPFADKRWRQELCFDFPQSYASVSASAVVRSAHNIEELLAIAEKATFSAVSETPLVPLKISELYALVNESANKQLMVLGDIAAGFGLTMGMQQCDERKRGLLSYPGVFANKESPSGVLLASPTSDELWSFSFFEQAAQRRIERDDPNFAAKMYLTAATCVNVFRQLVVVRATVAAMEGDHSKTAEDVFFYDPRGEHVLLTVVEGQPPRRELPFFTFSREAHQIAYGELSQILVDDIARAEGLESKGLNVHTDFMWLGDDDANQLP